MQRAAGAPRRARHTVSSLLAVFLIGVEAWTGGLARAARADPRHPVSVGRPGHAVISVLLAAQLHRLEATRHGSLWDRQSSPMVPLEVRSTRDVAGPIRALGGRVEADINGRITTARLPADRIRSLARRPGVVELDPSLPIRELLDRSVPDIRANQVWSLTDSSGLPLRGSHVLIGLVDFGIDYHNADFKNPDGSTRIKYIWDQTTDGNPPAGYDFGYECDAAAINSGACPEKDTDGHGTHVAGIAAGNGLSGNPPTEIGVAPAADIIAVKLGDETDKLIDAWQYLVDKAKQLGEPIVINNSIGQVLSPHDGSSEPAVAADELAGPGRIFVAADGNEGHLGQHVDGTLAQDGTASVPLTANGHESDIMLGLFYPVRDTIRLTFRDVDTGMTVGPASPGDTLNGNLTTDGTTTVALMAGNATSTSRAVIAEIQSKGDKPITGHFSLDIQGATIADTGRYDGWIEEDDGAAFDHPDESDTLDTPADARSVISVGDYATRVTWTDVNGVQHNACDGYPCVNGVLRDGDIVSFSSAGPTLDGRQKPDLAAPGTMIISSLSQDAPICKQPSDENCIPPALVVLGGKNVINSGTSMAAPHVSGTVALMLQADPKLDPAQVVSILRATARHDEFTGTAAWTPQFGAGKLDALAAVQAVLGLPHPTPTPTYTSTPRPTPAATPTRLPTAVKVDAVRLQAANRKGAPAIHTARAGSIVYLFLYWTVTGSPAAIRPRFAYSAALSGKVVARSSVLGTRASYTPGNYAASFPVRLRRMGTYVFSASLTVGAAVHRSTTSIKVQR